jgi:hypothetical protein
VRAAFILFVLAVLFGNLITLAIPYLGPAMRTTVSQMTIINLTIAGGPILGLFLLGIFVPFANNWVYMHASHTDY